MAIWLHGIEIWGDELSAGRAAALRAADRLLVNSRYTLERFEAEHFPLQNARVVHLATEEDEPAPVRTPSGRPVALCFGRVDKANMRKGHVEVIEAWPAVVSAIPDARLLVAGGGDGLDILKALAARSPVADAIEILGYVPEADVPALWQRAELYAQPSWKEGFGLTYVEAMRQGVPVVASKNDAGQEVNAHGVSGLNVDLERPGDLADQLVALLRDPGRMEALGRGARERWSTHFRFGSFVERFLAALDDPGASAHMT